MNSKASLNAMADELLLAQLSKLRLLSATEVASLPESSSSQVTLDGHACTLTVFAQSEYEFGYLVTVQLSRPSLLGISSYHNERGLVFGDNGVIREATSDDLFNSGG
jgi:hypothetical protein